ncbi:MAG: ABC transporter ATP-binding protein [Myxococcales bacterium]|nr:ABC transporter ATP-binding protein [Myxococcales bacterium]
MTENGGSGDVLIQINGLHRSYVLEGQELHVLRGIDIQIQARERVSIIGPSGSGKSTFLHVLGTLDAPDAGRILFDGKDVFSLPPGALADFRNQTIGFVFQFHHLLPEFSALENVMMPVLIHRVSTTEAERRARAMLDRVGLGSRSKHRPGELSGGEQQRVSIARALVMQPRLLLADEPTGNLDEETADGIHRLLDEMNDELDLTIVLVTHRSELAQRVPRQLQMQDGVLRPVRRT